LICISGTFEGKRRQLEAVIRRTDLRFHEKGRFWFMLFFCDLDNTQGKLTLCLPSLGELSSGKERVNEGHS
jgi:hypothetical protein